MKNSIMQCFHYSLFLALKVNTIVAKKRKLTSILTIPNLRKQTQHWWCNNVIVKEFHYLTSFESDFKMPNQIWNARQFQCDALLFFNRLNSTHWALFVWKALEAMRFIWRVKYCVLMQILTVLNFSVHLRIWTLSMLAVRFAREIYFTLKWIAMSGLSNFWYSSPRWMLSNYHHNSWIMENCKPTATVLNLMMSILKVHWRLLGSSFLGT